MNTIKFNPRPLRGFWCVGITVIAWLFYGVGAAALVILTSIDIELKR